MAGRPYGVTALELVFEMIALAAGLLGARGLSGAPPAIPSSSALLFLLLFVVSAVIATGLHRCRGWVHAAARVWSAVSAALLVWLFLGPEHGLPLPLVAAFPIGFALFGFCWLLESYLPRVLGPT